MSNAKDQINAAGGAVYIVESLYPDIASAWVNVDYYTDGIIDYFTLDDTALVESDYGPQTWVIDLKQMIVHDVEIDANVFTIEDIVSMCEAI